ncbi:MAG TPA: M43 family zinc metalloprotease, partial [Saprospiraceae bacterium]|nr:M43 family zinc metalloprotease [Saprospiraceae bacterium]
HSGKTLVHLMGVYLGLQALWTNLECADDGVEDTPIHNAPNSSCYGQGHISLCPGNPMEMVGNFMDSNPDDCAYMFTKGQVARMHATLGELGYRSHLLKGQKL